MTGLPLEHLDLAKFLFAFLATVSSPDLAFEPRWVLSVVALPYVEVVGGLWRLAPFGGRSSAVQLSSNVRLGTAESAVG